MADTDYDQLPSDSALAYVRSLIPDMEKLRDPLNADNEDSYLFDDATLERFIAFARGNNPKRAAADACDAIGGSEMLILKVVTTEDLATKGDVLGKEWGAKATRLRRDADADDDAGDVSNSFIASSPYLKRPVPYDPMRRRVFY